MKITEAEPDLIISCVEAVSKGCETARQIVEYIEKKEYSEIAGPIKGKYAKALIAGQELGILDVSGSKPLTSKVNLMQPLMLPVKTDEQKGAVFKEFLQEFDPFVLYLSLMQDGNDSASAAARTCAILKIKPMLKQEINTLSKWGVYAEILEETEGSITISAKIRKRFIDRKVKSLKKLIDALNGKIAGRTFLRSFLGQEIYSFLPKAIIADLVDAIEDAINKPEDSVTKMGTAFEDYLKHYAKSTGLSLVTSKGGSISAIGPVLKLLRNNGKISKYQEDVLKGLEVFTCKDLFDGLRVYRNLGHHGLDPIEDARWSLSTEVALVGIFQLLISIRSTYQFGIKGKVTY